MILVTWIFHVLSLLLIGAGLIFFIGASVGVVRFPDFYTRMHAAGKGDTLSTLLLLSGVSLHFLTDAELNLETFIIVVKIVFIAIFIMITSPTSTHALMQSGYEQKIKPFTKNPDGTITQGSQEEAS